MAMRFELWDGESGNLIWTFPSEADALAQVRAFVRENGMDAVRGLTLVRAEEDGRGGVIAEDAALVARAMPDDLPLAAAS